MDLWPQRCNREIQKCVLNAVVWHHDLRARENMHQNHQTRNAKPLLKLLFGIPIARPRALAAVELSMVASLTPAAVHAQEYPWCLSRDRLSLLLL